MRFSAWVRFPARVYKTTPVYDATLVSYVTPVRFSSPVRYSAWVDRCSFPHRCSIRHRYHFGTIPFWRRYHFGILAILVTIPIRHRCHSGIMPYWHRTALASCHSGIGTGLARYRIGADAILVPGIISKPVSYRYRFRFDTWYRFGTGFVLVPVSI